MSRQPSYRVSWASAQAARLQDPQRRREARAALVARRRAYLDSTRIRLWRVERWADARYARWDAEAARNPS